MKKRPERAKSPVRVSYWKNQPGWKRTVYVLGLPRSGKSTIFNILASCDHVEGLEEPLDLLGIAQKVSWYQDQPEVTENLKDLYLSLMDNHYSELTLGRSYNLRVQDKSFILNFKTEEHLARAQARNRRLDVIDYLKDKDSVFLIVFNDVEDSLEFITDTVPQSHIVYVKRDWRDVAVEIRDKGWLSSEQLKNQTNLLPGYQSQVRFEDADFYIPFVIPPEVKDRFIFMSDLDRAILYTLVQDINLQNAVSRIEVPSFEIKFEDLVRDPRRQIGVVREQLCLEESFMYRKNITKLEEAMAGVEFGGGRDCRPSAALVDILKELNIALPT